MSSSFCKESSQLGEGDSDLQSTTHHLSEALGSLIVIIMVVVLVVELGETTLRSVKVSEWLRETRLCRTHILDSLLRQTPSLGILENILREGRSSAGVFQPESEDSP